ncbi:Hypothetical predicted protein [Podarcis lilfordi]|uniref:Uncharacterized protein n=1 Tax=Podarcis lilfordi TaxID=74358 RepID=A0AA35JLH1_9SAUR|nr:Hypothetical predicted protein [Podarcis lilfordi]
MAQASGFWQSSLRKEMKKNMEPVKHQLSPARFPHLPHIYVVGKSLASEAELEERKYRFPRIVTSAEVLEVEGRKIDLLWERALMISTEGRKRGKNNNKEEQRTNHHRTPSLLLPRK